MHLHDRPSPAPSDRSNRFRCWRTCTPVLVEQKATLLPKHPLAQAIGYALNQWAELTLFTRDGEAPLHNNLAEQQMKRIALLRKNRVSRFPAVTKLNLHVAHVVHRARENH